MPHTQCKNKLDRSVVVISQPMYFPWAGLLEQIRLADIFIHYEDVQFTRGFFNRVQIKNSSGIKWMTVPVKNHPRDRKINEVLIDYTQDWRALHRRELSLAYKGAPFLSDVLMLVDQVFSENHQLLSELTIASVMILADYFNLCEGKRFLSSKNLCIGRKSSQRLLDIVTFFGAHTYVTGHGARNYLEHELFDKASVSVEYMDYQYICYPQLHGPFTPYVSALDLIANCGTAGRQYILSNSVPYKEFLHERK